MKKLILILLSVVAVQLSIFAQQNAIDFDGVDDRINCGNASTVQITGTQITLEAWVNPTAFGTQNWNNNIIDKETWTPQNGYMLRCGAGGIVNFNFGSGSYWNELNTSTAVLPLNTWTHIAATYDGIYSKIYINGVATDSIMNSASIANASSADLVIGDDSQGGRNFQGSIDEVRIWNVARTKAQITADMNAEICSGQIGLVGYYRFNQGVAAGTNSGLTTVVNNAVGGLGATLINSSLSGATSNWVAGMALTPATNSTAPAIYDTICDGESFTFGGQSYTQSGSYQNVQLSSNFCDSITPIELTVNPAYYLTVYDTICQGSPIYIGGVAYSTNGVHYANIQTTEGCDSNIILHLVVKPVNTSYSIVAGGTAMYALSTAGSFQWFNCDTKLVVPGETSYLFYPSVNGNFSVIVTEGGCTDTSACASLLVGIEENDINAEIVISPNPSNGVFNIEIQNTKVNNIHICVYDAVGKKLYEQNINENTTQIDLSNFENGIYNIIFETDDYRVSKRLMKY